MQIFLCIAVIMLIFLNGATDASNAIACAVTSGALSMRRAAILAAFGNMAGGVLSAVLFSRVGQSVADAAEFGVQGEAGALSCLLAAVLFTALAWCARLPTSESHALLASMAGVTAAMGGGGLFDALVPAFVWMSLCTLCGFVAGLLFPRLLPRSLTNRRLSNLQIACAALGSFFHGAQDLPKFLAILSAAEMVDLSSGLLFWFFAAVVMGIGTLLGGRRMTEAVGKDLARLTPRGALSSDLASAATLLILSVAGVPASTTHAKTAAVAGTALTSSHCKLHRRQMGRFLLAWAATFPICAVFGYGCARLFSFLF